MFHSEKRVGRGHRGADFRLLGGEHVGVGVVSDGVEGMGDLC